jgi:putative PIN family toxin of toxin-antitoxin system
MPIIIEYQKVMQRDFKFTEQEIIEATTKILKIFQMVTPKEKVDIIKNDDTDNKIIECAICANAQYIISYDKHLLKLKKFRNIEIVLPKEFPKKR